MEEEINEETQTISGKDLAAFLNARSSDYKKLYPNMKGNRKRREGEYCPCSDLGIDSEICQGILTVMDVFKMQEIKNFPKKIIPATWGRYQSGDVLIDDNFAIAYLYIGKIYSGNLSRDEDVVLNLGGDTSEKGNIQKGYINKRTENTLFSTRKVFPKSIYSKVMSDFYFIE